MGQTPNTPLFLDFRLLIFLVFRLLIFLDFRLLIPEFNFLSWHFYLPFNVFDAFDGCDGCDVFDVFDVFAGTYRLKTPTRQICTRKSWGATTRSPRTSPRKGGTWSASCWRPTRPNATRSATCANTCGMQKHISNTSYTWNVFFFKKKKNCYYCCCCCCF